MALDERDIKRRRLDGSEGIGHASISMPVSAVSEVKAWDEYVTDKVSWTHLCSYCV